MNVVYFYSCQSDETVEDNVFHVDDFGDSVIEKKWENNWDSNKWNTMAALYLPKQKGCKLKCFCFKKL